MKSIFVASLFLSTFSLFAGDLFSPAIVVKKGDIKVRDYLDAKTGDVVTEKTILFGMKTCLNAKELKRIGKTSEMANRELTLIGTNGALIPIKSDKSGCVTSVEVLTFKASDKQRYIPKVLTIIDDATAKITHKIIYVNPWNDGAFFGRENSDMPSDTAADLLKGEGFL